MEWTDFINCVGLSGAQTPVNCRLIRVFTPILAEKHLRLASLLIGVIKSDNSLGVLLGPDEGNEDFY